MIASGRAFRSSIIRRTTTLILFMLMLVGFAGLPVTAAAQTTRYGPYDGCYYFWDGSRYIEVQCVRSDGSVEFYLPSANGWQFTLKVTPLGGGAGRFDFADGSRIDLSSDGTFIAYLTNGNYFRFASDGSLMSAGYVDSQGIMFQTIGPSPGVLYPRVLPIAGMPIGSNVFGPLTAAQDLTTYNNCLQLGNSNTDYDGHYGTGFNELAAHCGN